MKPASVNPVTEPFASDQAAIQRIVEDVYVAAAQKDWKRLEAFHLNSPKFSKWGDAPHAGRIDYQTTMRTERETFGALTKFDYKVHDVRVDVFGPAAVATFQLSYDAVLNNAPLQATEKGTLVFVKSDGEWKIVHEHFSYL